MFSKMLILFNNYGPKKTDMPLDEAKKSVPPLKVLAAQTVQGLSKLRPPLPRRNCETWYKIDDYALKYN